MRERWHLLIAIFALVFQAAAIAFMHVVAQTVYANPPYSGESWEWTASLVGLAGCAGISMLLGCLGVCALLTRSRLRVAITLIVLCCIPALIGGAVYAYAMLVFLTMV
jgi:uncharacterized membrane protein